MKNPIAVTGVQTSSAPSFRRTLSGLRSKPAKKQVQHLRGRSQAAGPKPLRSQSCDLKANQQQMLGWFSQFTIICCLYIKHDYGICLWFWACSPRAPSQHNMRAMVGVPQKRRTRRVCIYIYVFIYIYIYIYTAPSKLLCNVSKWLVYVSISARVPPWQSCIVQFGTCGICRVSGTFAATH